MHARIVSNFALKFVMFGLPAIGIIMAESMAWNIVWWVLYFLWESYLTKHEIFTTTGIGTMWAQLPYIVLIEMEVSNHLLWGGANLWAAMVYWTIYRQAMLINAKMKALTEDLGVTDA